ncbi:MAG TPA: c-type cytochrome [Bryobacteraceae bacterium]|jgi:mono/diheme cytochrome c family protein|nr:c-type cytochrome [Bryobacteraceae bacterium]
MSQKERLCLPVALLLLAIAQCSAQHPSPEALAAPPARQQLPDAPGKEVVQKLCATCHSVSIIAGRGLTRDEWTEVVSSMISRGAKGTQGEFSQVIDYLSRNLPPKATGTPGAQRRGGGGGFSMGPDNKQIVDPAAAARGKTVYLAQCVSCHGPEARGDDKGPDLVRSLTILHDRYGSTLKPFLQKGHQTQSGMPSTNLTDAQITDLSHFLHQQVDNTLRSGPYSKVLNVLTGDAAAGEAYFNGPGGCKACHSPTGDLAGIASRYEPPVLQQRFLFPHTVGFRAGAMAPVKPLTATVTTPDGQSVTGIVEKIDDFNISLRDSSGDYHTFTRSPDVKVEKHDPYAAHEELLDKYTDKDIHDVVAYLETLK